MMACLAELSERWRTCLSKGFWFLLSWVHDGSMCICLLCTQEAIPPRRAPGASLMNTGRDGPVAVTLGTPGAAQTASPGSLPSLSRRGGLSGSPCHL